MRRPSSIRLGARDVRFRYRSAKSMPNELGLTHYAKALIDIRSGQLPLDEKDTILHEVFHMILNVQGREYAGEVEETYVRALATGLAVALEDNPEFAAWLCKPVSQP
jgi:hypothetical protein